MKIHVMLVNANTINVKLVNVNVKCKYSTFFDTVACMIPYFLFEHTNKQVVEPYDLKSAFWCCVALAQKGGFSMCCIFSNSVVLLKIFGPLFKNSA